MAAPNALSVNEQDQAAEDRREHAAHQQASVPHPRQDGDGDQPPGQQKQPVERQDHERTRRAQAHTPDQKDRQPAGDRPFIAELEEQQQREQHRAGTAEILQRLPQSGMRAFGRRRRRSARHKFRRRMPGTTAMKIRMLGTV